MKSVCCIALILFVLFVPTTSRAVLFDFDNAPLYASLPIDLTVGGITAHLSATGQGFSVQRADVLGFTPVGFAGYCLYPNSVFAADLLVGFSVPLSDFSIMFAPEEYGCDSSARMRVTAYMDGVFVGTDTTRADPPGTWPTGTLSFSSAQDFNSVVVHYDSPPACGDWGPIFMADNMNVTPSTSSAGPSAAVGVLSLVVSPNPFKGEAVVRFAVPRTGPVSITVHDAQGRLVRTLSEGVVFEPGFRDLRWDGRDEGGHAVMSGIYLCRVRAAAQETATRMILLRSR